MILGSGIDIIEPERLRSAVERWGSRFLERIFSAAERETCERSAQRWQRYAGRFAAKEALVKALGTGVREGIVWRQIETVNDGRGKPGIVLSGKARARADALGVKRIHVSISDLPQLAAASVVLEGESP